MSVYIGQHHNLLKIAIKCQEEMTMYEISQQFMALLILYNTSECLITVDSILPIR